jgi:hypothetical protein
VPRFDPELGEPGPDAGHADGVGIEVGRPPDAGTGDEDAVLLQVTDQLRRAAHRLGELAHRVHVGLGGAATPRSGPGRRRLGIRLGGNEHGGRRDRRHGNGHRGRHVDGRGGDGAPAGLIPRPRSGIGTGRQIIRPVDGGGLVAIGEIDVPLLPGQATPDDLEREEVLALLEEDPAEPLDVLVVELAVTRRRPFGVDEALALEEPDLGDADVGELLSQQGQDLTDRQVQTFCGHGARQPWVDSVKYTNRNFPTCSSSPWCRGPSSIRSRLR